MPNMNYKGLLSMLSGDKGQYLLIFIVQEVVIFFMTHLTKHFSEYLTSVTICCIFIVLFGVLFPLRLLLRWFRRTFTSTDKITRCDCRFDPNSRRNRKETPPSSIALTFRTLPSRTSIVSWALWIRTVKSMHTVQKMRGSPLVWPIHWVLSI